MGNFSADFLSTSTGTLGIIGLPELSAALRRAGVNVITGGDFKESAIAIRDAISGGGAAFPVLISNDKAPTKKAWANRIAGDTAVFLLDTHTEDGITCDGAREIATPVEASKLLQAVGLGQYASAVSGLLVEMDGKVSGASAPEASSDFDAELSELLGGDDEFDPFSDDDDDMELPAYDAEDIQEPVREAPAVYEAPAAESPAVRVQEPETAPQTENSINPFADDFDDNFFEPEETILPVAPVQPEPVFIEQSQPVQRFEPAALSSGMEQYAAPADEEFNPWADDEDEVQDTDLNLSFDDFDSHAPVYPPSTVVEEFIPPVPVQQPTAPARNTEAPVRSRRPVAPSYQPEPVRVEVTDVDFDFPAAPASNDITDFDFGNPAPVRPEPTKPAVQDANPFAPFEEDDEDDDDLFLSVRVAAPSTKPMPSAPAFRRPEPAVQEIPKEAPVSFDLPEEEPSAYDLFDNEDAYEESADLFASDNATYTPEARSISNEPVIIRGDTPVLFVWGAKGGIGKTTMAIAAAQRAASMGIRTVLIDGNRGQGDTRKYLALDKPEHKLPSVHDVALGHDATSVIISPVKMVEVRGKSTAAAKFALVQAPLSRFADPAIITGWIYNRVINAAREVAELVIIDTQTLELFDTSKLVSETILPALVKDAYSLAVTDLNIAGTSNLKDQLKSFAEQGMSKDRTMVLVNLADDPDAVTGDKLSRYFGEHASYLGSVNVDMDVKDAMNKGQLPALNDSAMDLIDAALLKVTNNAKFTKNAEVQPSARSRFRKVGRK